MNELIKSIALGVARNGIMAAGGWMANHGYANADQATSFEGSVLFLIGFGFTIYDKFVVDGKIKDATPPVIK